MIKRIKKLVLYFLYKRKFHSLHHSSFVADCRMLTPKYIGVGKNCIIWYNCRIEGVTKYNEKTYDPLIVLEDGVKIQQNCHITCANKIVIGANTCISAGVTITDINHRYQNVNVAVENQDLEIKFVSIGADSKIYNGAVILPGVTIGKHCVVGANSVVVYDIPDYCVAVGAPAYIVKRYNFESRIWEKTDKNGNFIGN